MAPLFLEKVRRALSIPPVGMAMPGRGLKPRLVQILEGLPTPPVSRARVTAVIVFSAISSALFAAGTLTPRFQQNTVQKYDVVSIKPCAGLPLPGSGRGQNPRFPSISPGYAHWGCVTVAELANQAYVGDDRPLLNRVNPRNPGPDDPRVVRGGPEWVYSERFAIEARADGAADRIVLTGPMLRSLLEDRFQLKLRRATEEQSMYALTVMKSGLKLAPTKPEDCWVRPAGSPPGTPAPAGFDGKHSCGTLHGEFPNGNNRTDHTGTTLEAFAGFLSGLMDRYVLDETGVAGLFNITLEYAPNENTRAYGPRRAPQAGAAIEPPQGTAPNIFKALEALGLKLEPTKGPAEYLVIDSVQRPKPDFASALPAGGVR